MSKVRRTVVIEARPKSTETQSTPPGMKLETAAIESLKPDPRNARKHDARNLESIAASLKRYGQQKPIVIDADGVVLAGNGTLTAAKSLGWTQIQAVRTSLRGAEAMAFAIADNRTGELAAWDVEELARQADELHLEGLSLGDLGFNDEEFGSLLNSLTAGEPAQAAKANVKKGDETFKPQFKIIIDCNSETHQASLIDEFEGRGLKFSAPSM